MNTQRNRACIICDHGLLANYTTPYSSIYRKLRIRLDEVYLLQVSLTQMKIVEYCILKQVMLVSFERPNICVQDFHDLENLAFLFTKTSLWLLLTCCQWQCLNFVLSKLALYIVFFFFWFSSYSNIKIVCTLLASTFMV